MKSISYRPSDINDCVALAKVNVETWRTSYSGILPQDLLDGLSWERRAKDFEQRFNRMQFYSSFVAEDSQAGIIGFVDFGLPRNCKWRYQLELYAIYLLKDFQRRGIGTELFRLGVEAGIQQGLEGMLVRVLKENPYSAFYRKLGGKIVDSEVIQIGKDSFEEDIYGFENLRDLLQMTKF